jgi:hypothetical protein
VPWPRTPEDREVQVSMMDDFFKIVAAGPAFFVSAWLLMIFAGITARTGKSKS